MPLLETSFGGWQAAGAAAPPATAARRRAAGATREIYLVDKPGAPQIADPHRMDRRAAIDARLLPDPGHEHDPRRVVHARG